MAKIFKKYLKTRLNNFLCAITRRESARLGHVCGTKGITQAWKFANETEVFLLERTNDHVQINVIGIIELLSLFKR